MGVENGAENRAENGADDTAAERMEPGLQIQTRGARLEDYPTVRDIIAQAFDSNDEADLWDYLVAHDPALRPEGVRLATAVVAGDRPVACTVVLPRRIRARREWVDGAVITLVACHPEFQNRGFGSASVRDAIRYLYAKGLALGILYGHPNYYPRHGFVPVLPRMRTTLRVAGAAAGVAGAGRAGALFRPAQDGDYGALLALYDSQLTTYPCAVARSADPWLWKPRNGDQTAVLVAPDRQAYALVTVPPAGDTLYVAEGAAAGRDAVRRLLDGLLQEATACGKTEVVLSLPPNHPLAEEAAMRGAGQTVQAATAGMAVVANWGPLLPPRYEVGPDGLHLDGVPVLKAGHAAMVQLALGYVGADQLLSSPDDHSCPSIARPTEMTRLRQDFPPAFPKWSLAPFWH